VVMGGSTLFLYRDGVINMDHGDIRQSDQFVFVSRSSSISLRIGASRLVTRWKISIGSVTADADASGTAMPSRCCRCASDAAGLLW
jgi:hypothetical protein